jgi:NAD(P)-dependent dehydrogenase (short-subunit alcohol dehydrogenase family)
MTAKYFPPDLLEGKVALVTGGGTGIGREIARGLGETGARVVIASRTPERLEESTQALRAGGLDVSWKQLDVRDPQQVDAIVAEVTDEIGPIDILVNNAVAPFLSAPRSSRTTDGARSRRSHCMGPSTARAPSDVG